MNAHPQWHTFSPSSRPKHRTLPKNHNGSVRSSAFRCGLGHWFFDDLQEITGVLFGSQISQFFIGLGTLVVVEDRDLAHRRIEDAPAGAKPRWSLLLSDFLDLGQGP